MTPRRLLAHAWPYRGRLALVAVLMLVESAAMLAVPWVAGQVAGGLLVPGTVALPMGWLSVLLVAVLAVIAGLRVLVALVSGAVSTRLLADLRLLAHDKLQSLPLSFHQAHKQGDLLALSTYEVSRLSDFLSGTLVGALPLLLTALGAIVLMFRIDPVLALLVPLLVPVFYLMLKIIGRRLRVLSQRIQEAEAEAVALAGEDLEMLPAIKAFTREGPTSGRYGAQVATARDLALQEVRIHAVLSPAIQLTSAVAAVALLLLAGSNVQAGQMTPAQMVSFLLYAGLLTGPVASLADLYGQIQSTRGTLARLHDVLDAAPEPGADAPGRIGRSRGAVRYEGVVFNYPERAPALAGVTLDIRAGETVALTGANGAGKSTLIALLMRFFDPTAGRILLDGQDIAGLRLADLRRQIGVVPQRALLFNGTIFDNIAFGLDGAGVAQVEAAARLAQAHDFVMALPQGYATVIGDHGVRLSGGQGQRVALARALVKDPPILVLDEATSMYDLEGETAFVESCADALRDRTVILITHRPATLALADRVIALADGRIVTAGGTAGGAAGGTAGGTAGGAAGEAAGGTAGGAVRA
ncbi:MAG: ABC transporter ATP-binding protein [Rhodobacterales bacterium]|nr:ABC transporter ATP-binding protein [Rhodobacterales bacterium]